jgi:hypothetical protein
MPFKTAEKINVWRLTKYFLKIFFVLFQTSFIVIFGYYLIRIESIFYHHTNELDAFAFKKEKHLERIVHDAWTVNVAKIEEVKTHTGELMEMLVVLDPHIRLKVMKLQKSREEKRLRPFRAWDGNSKKWVIVTRKKQ